nr:helicase-related protein [uncultured Helicobacter sp.]
MVSAFFNAKAFEAFSALAPYLQSLSLIVGESTPSDNYSPIISFNLHNDPFDMSVKDFHIQLESISTAKIAHNFINAHSIKIQKLQQENVLLHSKLYLIHNQGIGDVIIGSSNFTGSVLGLYGDKSNKELNVLCDSKRASKEAFTYFKTLEKECKDCTKEVLDSLQTSFFYHSPKDIFAKICSCVESAQKPTLSESERLTQGVKAFGLYDFQQDAALELLSRLKRYALALLASPVGSGKTLTALAVASVYNNVIIISPKNLTTQWASYFNVNEQSPYYNFINDMGFRVRILSYYEAQNPKDQDKIALKSAQLIIIDESHNFRNGIPRTRSLKQNGYQKLQNNLNTNSHLLLLSATPINNSFLDLSNQLCLLSSHITDSITQNHLEPKEICTKAQANLQNALKSGDDVELDEDYYAITHIIFSHSSEQIIAHLKALNKDMPKQHIRTIPSSSIPVSIDFSFQKLSEILGLNEEEQNGDTQEDFISFSIYDPYKFLPKHTREQVLDKQLENLGDYTTPRGFLCMSLLKALESSLDAFKPILEKIITYHHRFLKHKAAQWEDKNADELENDEASILPTRLAKLAELGLLHELSEDFTQIIQKDLALLERIAQKLETYESERDFPQCAKYQECKKIIDSINDIKTDKLLIFSESIPTTHAICQALRKDYPHYVIETISGELKPNEFAKLKNRFSPRSLKYTLQENEREIDILISSNVLNEGANLQDCKNLLNWDIAFNPVHSIQRIGRIWRIGSIHTSNHITHLFPNTDIESYIKLESKLRFKIAAAQTLTSLNDPHALQNAKNIKAFEEKRKKAYKSLESESIALEDSTEFNLNQFSTLESVLSTLAYHTKPSSALPDGIFSIATSPNLPKNHLYAFLQDTDSKKYYCTHFDIGSASLLPSCTSKDGIANLLKIAEFKDDSSIHAKEFEKLELLTQDFRDITPLKEIFASLTSQLEALILSHSKAANATKKSNAQFSSTETRRFSLIAWLLVNPYEILAHNASINA